MDNGTKSSNGNPVNGHVDSNTADDVKTNDAKSSKCSCNLVKRVSNAIISNMERGFYWIGSLIGTHPWKSLLISLFLVGIFTAGAAKFKESSDQEALWVPSDANVYIYKNWVDANFPGDTRFVSIIFIASNVLLPTQFQAIYSFYAKAQNLVTSSGKNYTDICVQAGSSCLMNSILELWSYDGTTINAASQSDIVNKIKTTTTSPMYYNDYDATLVLGQVTRTSGDISGAAAAKLTFFLKGDSANENDAMLWEKDCVDLALQGQADISSVYVFATRSFSDVGGETIQGDVTLLSAGYMLVIVFIIFILGRFNWLDFGLGMAVSGIVVIGISIGFSFGLASAAGWEYTPLHSVLPFLLLGIGVDDLFVVVAAVKSLPPEHKEKPVPERIALALKHAGVSVTVTSLTDMCAFGIGATTVLPALKSFCVFCCLGIMALYILSCTFFVACVTLNANRTEARRNSVLCCYKQSPNYRSNDCSQRELIVEFFRKHYGPKLIIFPVKIVVLCVTVLMLGFGIWGFVILKQDFDPIWFLPTDSYPYKYNDISNTYFPDNGEYGAIYCKDLDYYNSQTKFETLYSRVSSASYIANGTVDSWFKSFTDYLSTATAASVTSKIDGVTKYPTSDQNFHDLLYDFVTTVSEGQRHEDRLIISGTSPNRDLQGSYIKFQHIAFTTSTEKVNGMDNMISLVSEIFPNNDCFPYAREYLSWYTNKVIQAELYRNLGIASLCVFIVCLVLIANLVTSIMVFSCVLFTLLDVGGMMHFWGLTIDTVTSIILILSIGLAVDYSAHIGHCFMTITGSRNERVKSTLVEMGSPVFSGGLSTFLAFSLLIGSNSYVFTTFFKVFLLVVTFGLFHGLLYLPVLLSFLGPAAYDSASSSVSDNSEIDVKSQSKSSISLNSQAPALNNKVNPVCSNIPPPDYRSAVTQDPPRYSPSSPSSQQTTNIDHITPVDA